MGTLNGKKALVTGLSRGIGAAIVRRLVAEGASVAVNHRANAKQAKELVHELDSAQTRVVDIQADVTDPAAIRALAPPVSGRPAGGRRTSRRAPRCRARRTGRRRPARRRSRRR